MFDIIKPQHPRQLEFLMLFTHVGQEEHVEWVRGSKNGNKFKTRNEQLWFLAVFVFGDNCCTGDWEPETAFEDLRLALGLRLRETETEADIISALCIVCFSRSHDHSQLRVLFWFLCCFRILVVLKFRASVVETGSGTQDQTERATSSQCTHLLYGSLVSFRRAGSFYVFCN